MRTLMLSLCTMLVVVSIPAQAQDAAQANNLTACAGIENDPRRLACYDQLAGRAPNRAAQVDALKPETPLFVPGAPEAQDASARGSLLDRRWELARDSKLGKFNLRAYKPVYLFPAFWASDLNQSPTSPNPSNFADDHMGLQEIEAKFQIGFKTKVAENLFGDNGDLWFGYTQVSHWQVYNGAISRPFRETNHEPELLLVFRNGYRIGHWHGRMLALGINHQSNGRSNPLSRSWNRFMLNIGLDRDNWALMIRPWVRIAESAPTNDNPDISDHIGRGDITLTRVLGRHEVSLMARHSMRGGARSRGAAQLDWGFPIHRNFRGHLQVFSGYGESMIDYNHRATYVGLGISLREWF